jgi:mannose-1-phosphate guanylyltransferase
MENAENITRVGVIMAGGSGERFWPLSRKNRPKQLLKLTDPDKNMLEEAVDRLAPIIAPADIYIVTGDHLVDAIVQGNVGIPEENVLAEPSKRNTAGCLAFAAAHMLATYGGDGSTISMAVVTADHQIGNPDRFRETVTAALKIAEEKGVLATHGILPTRPETGYGYIQADSVNHPIQEDNDIPIFPVAAFHEKPNEEKAEDFISEKKYYWNSGMFFWRVDTFLNELSNPKPKMVEAVHAMCDAMKHNDKLSVKRIFDTVENISIDYALMEHAKDVVVVRADYPWDDVGAWTSLDRTRTRDDEGNVLIGDPVVLDSSNCIVYNEAGKDDMAVSVVGAKDLIVVVTHDGILVVPKDKAQHVRHAVSELKDKGARQV